MGQRPIDFFPTLSEFSSSCLIVVAVFRCKPSLLLHLLKFPLLRFPQLFCHQSWIYEFVRSVFLQGSRYNLRRLIWLFKGVDNLLVCLQASAETIKSFIQLLCESCFLLQGEFRCWTFHFPISFPHSVSFRLRRLRLLLLLLLLLHLLLNTKFFLLCSCNISTYSLFFVLKITKAKY